MIKKTILLIVACILFSCNENDDFYFQALGEWKLVQMSGSIPNSETTGADMQYQEQYVFKANGTFEKTRDTDGVIEKAYGVYRTYNSPNEKILELTYNLESPIISNCTADLKEVMNITSKNTFTSTWHACDGSGLDYKKIN